MFVKTGKELTDYCNSHDLTIAEYTVENEVNEGKKKSDVLKRMAESLKVMKKSSTYALENKVKSVSGLIGGEAAKINNYKGESLTGDFMAGAMARALSCSEVNASMGKIIAAPTAGSCGIIPAVILSAATKLNKTDEEIVKALFTASGVGIIIAQNATLSGAEGGCQAECGSAAAMGAAAVVEMMGGTPQQALDAASIVIKCILGLVCDPIAGLVEEPCAMRNAMGTVNALCAADMVMSGISSIIPFDEVVSAMYKVGRDMPCELRETALGGLAATPTGISLKEKIFS